MVAFVPWQEILADALDEQGVIGVAAVVKRHLGRRPSRSEITSARRAASRYAATGHAQVVYLSATGASAKQARMVLALPEVDTSDLALLRRAADGSSLRAAQRSLVADAAGAKAVTSTLAKLAVTAEEIKVQRLARDSAALLAGELDRSLQSLGEFRDRLVRHSRRR